MSDPPVQTFTLRIRRVYLEAILAGTKRIEYRSVKPFYARLEDPSVQFLVLHYQTARRVLVQIRKVERIPCPPRLKQSDIPFTDEVYAIHLGRSQEL